MNDVTDTAQPDTNTGTAQANIKANTDAARTGSIEHVPAARRIGSQNVQAKQRMKGRAAGGVAASQRAATTAATHSASATATLGGLLQASRVARSLSLDEVSEQTHIAAPHLAALENDETIALPQTFITGYAKSYARFLGIEPEFLNKFFAATAASSNANSPASASSPLNSNTSSNTKTASVTNSPACAIASPLGGQPKRLAPLSTARKVTASIRKSVGFRSGSSWSGGLFGSPMGVLRVATTTTLPLLGLCVLAFAYHAIDSQFSDASRISASTHSLGQAPDQLGVLAHEALTAQHAQSEGRNPATRAVLANSSSPQPVLVVAAAAGRTQNDASGSFKIDRAPATGAPVATALATSTQATSTQARSMEATSMDATLPAQGLAAAAAVPGMLASMPALAYPTQTGRSVVPNTNMQDMHEPVGPGAVGMIAQLNMQDRLVIQVYEDSWVDVSDGSGNKLYRDLARAGRRIDVSGQLPFSLHLGNAPGLELELNGESIAITRYRSDNSARLTLASN